MRYIASLFICLTLMSGCPSLNAKTDPSSLSYQAIALRRLGSAIEGVTWEAGGLPGLSGVEIVNKACASDPSLCSHFGKNTIYARQSGWHAVVLLCSPDGKQLFIEDVACSPIPDRKAWESFEPCEFKITDDEVLKICAQ